MSTESTGAALGPDPYLRPVCDHWCLDRYVVRNAILDSFKSHLPAFHGTVLDIGCGYMPYKPIIMAPPSRAERYLGLDFEGGPYGKPDFVWDGTVIPLEDASVDVAVATEVFEHCPDPELVMRETYRVLKPGGFLFYTVPFLWPIHDAPYDEYRYTPFSLERHLRQAGFAEVATRGLGYWDASLAQMLALWVRRRPMRRRTRAVLSRLALPVIRWLASRDRSMPFADGPMITGLTGTATKAS